ncbi:stabilizer of axonemal microtubules 3 [Salminus brasiliensis]|uniref:stabilizer of axonemal microtubules 3 n=1 Tax=Salminus brasiliensis TaxID=930266 RepID=UPI003B8307E1
MDRWCRERLSLAQTSAGVGHYSHQRLPPVHTESCKNAPLPPRLQRGNRVPGPLHYSLTSHTEYDSKPIDGPLGNTMYSKASPHWNTHFLNELAQKLRDCRSVKVVSKPVSEMQDCYRGRSAPHEPLVDHCRTLLALYGRLDRAPALLPKEPQLSTSQADYRRFSRSELAPPSALNAPPIQGTLTKSAALSRLPPHKVPPDAASRLQLPRPCLALPHGGGHSLYMDSFTVPACLPKLHTPAAAQDGAKCREKSGRGLTEHILEVPKMYNTENQTCGKGKMVLV